MKLTEKVSLRVDLIKRAEVVFWDFDGVIKDSVKVKSDAFEQIFLPFGKEIAKKIKIHHEINGGMSRFDKLPIYLDWSGVVPSRQLVDEYAEKFSLLVKQKVIDSEWVDGILEYLQNNYKRQQFFLITATPQQEIEDILFQLKIESYFNEVLGSPIKKSNAIERLLRQYSISPENAVMVGDADSDYQAAQFNNIQFVLRRTDLNETLQQKLECQMVCNFQKI